MTGKDKPSGEQLFSEGWMGGSVENPPAKTSTIVQRGLELRQLKIELPDAQLILEADLRVNPSERVALVGPSGSGKSSLFRYVAGFNDPYVLHQGGIWLNGVEMTHVPVHKREIGVLFQEAALFSRMTVLENVCFGLKMRGWNLAAAKKEVWPWLERLGLSTFSDRPVEGLSGGERSRVAWVRTLVWKPKALLLDEPWSALDRELRAVMKQQLLEFHGDNPIPVLFVSHHEEDLKGVATRVVELVSMPGSASQRKLVECVPVISK